MPSIPTNTSQGGIRVVLPNVRSGPRRAAATQRAVDPLIARAQQEHRQKRAEELQKDFNAAEAEAMQFHSEQVEAHARAGPDADDEAFATDYQAGIEDLVGRIGSPAVQGEVGARMQRRFQAAASANSLAAIKRERDLENEQTKGYVEGSVRLYASADTDETRELARHDAIAYIRNSGLDPAAQEQMIREFIETAETERIGLDIQSDPQGAHERLLDPNGPYQNVDPSTRATASGVANRAAIQEREKAAWPVREKIESDIREVTDLTAQGTYDYIREAFEDGLIDDDKYLTYVGQLAARTAAYKRHVDFRSILVDVMNGKPGVVMNIDHPDFKNQYDDAYNLLYASRRKEAIGAVNRARTDEQRAEASEMLNKIDAEISKMVERVTVLPKTLEGEMKNGAASNDPQTLAQTASLFEKLSAQNRIAVARSFSKDDQTKLGIISNYLAGGAPPTQAVARALEAMKQAPTLREHLDGRWKRDKLADEFNKAIDDWSDQSWWFDPTVPEAMRAAMIAAGRENYLLAGDGNIETPIQVMLTEIENNFGKTKTGTGGEEQWTARPVENVYKAPGAPYGWHERQLLHDMRIRLNMPELTLDQIRIRADAMSYLEGPSPQYTVMFEGLPAMDPNDNGLITWSPDWETSPDKLALDASRVLEEERVGPGRMAEIDAAKVARAEIADQMALANIVASDGTVKPGESGRAKAIYTKHVMARVARFVGKEVDAVSRDLAKSQMAQTDLMRDVILSMPGDTMDLVATAVSISSESELKRANAFAEAAARGIEVKHQVAQFIAEMLTPRHAPNEEAPPGSVPVQDEPRGGLIPVEPDPGTESQELLPDFSVKTGANRGISGKMTPGLHVVSAVLKEFNVPFVMTEGVREYNPLTGEKDKNFHPLGYAFDVRAHDLTVSQRRTVIKSLKKRLPPGYEAVLHGVGKNIHFHVELDTKETKKELAAYRNNIRKRT